MNLQPPRYTQQGDRRPSKPTPWHQVPGYGLCPTCGEFGPCGSTQGNSEFKTQYRCCPNGHRFQTVVRR